uniref:Uncharacterized protein n=1 Tax=Knipowitschia caucasica TaxID=637954 RepID=A0AAV2K0U8_KNICA
MSFPAFPACAPVIPRSSVLSGCRGLGVFSFSAGGPVLFYFCHIIPSPPSALEPSNIKASLNRSDERLLFSVTFGAELFPRDNRGSSVSRWAEVCGQSGILVWVTGG